MYVIINKKHIIGEVNKLLNSKIKGEITIGDIEPGIISTFPLVSVRLSQVVVRDTLWKQHHHDLLKADNILIRLGLFSIFTGKPVVNKVIIERGSAYVFSDSTGYTNQYLFTPKDAGEPGKQDTAARLIPDVELRNMHVILDLNDRNKLYDVTVNRLNCRVIPRGNILLLDVNTTMLVHALAFNTGNGSFAKEKPIEGKFRVRFDRTLKIFDFNDIKLYIDHQPFVFTGKFDLAAPPVMYYLKITANNILYRQAAALVSQNITGKLNRFNIEQPVDVTAILDGTTRPNKMPLINIAVKITNSNISTPVADFTHASMMAYFNNQVNRNERRTDENMGFFFTGISAQWQNIPCNSDSTSITDVSAPVLKCDVRSAFNIPVLNEMLGSRAIEFIKGNCRVNVNYKGLIVGEDPAGANILGQVELNNAAIRYTPRNLLFNNCGGKIAFAGKDVYVKQLKAQSGSSQLVMNGIVKNCVSLIDQQPEKLVLNWNITSPKINLGDFISFLGKRPAAVATSTTKRRFLKMAGKIDRMLDDCSVDLQINAGRLMYKKFDASNVSAALRLTDRLVAIKNVSVQHAGGTLLLNGSLQENPSGNVLTVNTNMNNVDVTKVFTAFNNFGQDGITDENLRGRLTATINGTGIITNNAEIVPQSIKGIVDFSLKNGELINFEPVQNISKTAFKNRDFSDVRFAELKERLDINGSQIKVNRMEIQSSVLTMFVEGIYDIKKGTDLSIQIPLSNLKKKDADAELVNKGVASKTGVSLRLRAKTGKNGKAAISWDPFKKALKGRQRENAESTQVSPSVTTDATGKNKH